MAIIKNTNDNECGCGEREIPYNMYALVGVQTISPRFLIFFSHMHSHPVRQRLFLRLT